MRNLKFINASGEEIEFSISSHFLFSDLDTTNSVNIYSSKGANQAGATYLGNTLDVRDISFNATVVGNTVNEAVQLRNQLNKVFSPGLGEGWLFYKDGVKSLKIKCIPNKLPYWNEKFANKTKQSVLISLTANNPYWQDAQDVKKQVALWVGDFHFPVIIPQDTGIMVGHRVPSLIVNLKNDGEVPCGMTIIFKALATLTNPSLFNVNTREYIKITKGMVAGETITITTQVGNKKIIDKLNGVETDAMMYIDFMNSTFLQLAVGDNLFRYNADTGLDNLECTVIYSPQFLHT